MSTTAVGAYILLLCKAWHQSPPASLPNDDRVLARYARMTPDDWQAVKPEVMAAFTTGNDSRLHQKRLRREYESFRNKSEVRSEAARSRWDKSKSNANAKQMHCESNATRASGSGSESSEGGVQRGEFDAWWQKYPHKVGKQAAKRAYRTARRQADAKTLMDGVAAYITSKPPDRPWCNPATWLNQGRWDDQPATPGSRGPATGVAALTDADRASLAAYAKQREGLEAYPDGAQPVLQAMRKHLENWKKGDAA